jgi:hypothetical protein
MKVFLELEVGDSNASHLEDLLWDEISLALKAYSYEVMRLEVEREGVAVEQIFEASRLLKA